MTLRSIGTRHLGIVVLACGYVWIMAGASQEPTAPIRVGQAAPTVLATSLTGQSFTVTFERPTVLYVQTPACFWCIRNADNMSALFRQRGKDFVFIGLSLRKEGLREYLDTTPHPFPVYVASEKTITEYGLGTIPSTIVVDKGNIVKKWNGAFDKSLPAVQDFFKVKLPGISSGVTRWSR